jgi:hypothetical protein
MEHMEELFERDARDYALSLVDEGMADARHMLLCALKYMSVDEVRNMLDWNEMSPRFKEEGEDEDEE